MVKGPTTLTCRHDTDAVPHGGARRPATRGSGHGPRSRSGRRRRGRRRELGLDELGRLGVLGLRELGLRRILQLRRRLLLEMWLLLVLRLLLVLQLLLKWWLLVVLRGELLRVKRDALHVMCLGKLGCSDSTIHAAF